MVFWYHGEYWCTFIVHVPSYVSYKYNGNLYTFIVHVPSLYHRSTSSNKWGTVRVPVFGRHRFFGTSEHYGKAHGSLLSGWMNYDYTACCWFPASSNILILPSQFWQIRFESYWLHCSKCRILVLLRYHTFTTEMRFCFYTKEIPWQYHYMS